MKIFFGIIIGGLIGSITGYYGQCTQGQCPLTSTPLRGAVYGIILGLLITLSLNSQKKSSLKKPIEIDKKDKTDERMNNK